MKIKQETRREYLIIEAIDPANGKKIPVQISFNRIRSVGSRSMGQAKECAFLVPQVLLKPTAIFEGLRRDADETWGKRGTGWRCYCGIPGSSYTEDGREQQPYEGEVFLVFVNDEAIAYNWRWEKSDPKDPSLPEDLENRFKERKL